jgi:hypothetical protein
MSEGFVGSVLIPAHNEQAVIRRCLDTLFAGIDPAALEVVVACNGCTDDTAAIARASGYPVRVLELEAPGKPGALRAGEQALTAFPRLYLDADVQLPGPAAVAVLDHLAGDGVVAARPPFRYATGRASAVVRRYYRARSQVPAVMGSLWGAGVYGLSAAGRARFGAYPDVVAEDLYVDQHFASAEIDIVGEEAVVVTTPADLRSLLKVMRRAYRGADLPDPADLAASPTATAPDGSRPTTGSTARDVVRLARTGPAGVLDAATYAAVTIAARLYVRLGRSTRWERDESSRADVEPAGV